MAMASHINGALRRVPVWPLYALGFVPAIYYLWLAIENRLGADPVAVLTHQSGLIALQLLIAALAVTPLRDLAGVSLLRFRRMLGLMAFWYVTMHLTIWLALDRQLDWPRIGEDLIKRPYIMLGMAAMVLLVPLAATSSDWAIRRMGAARWRGLHRLAYPATALGAVHFVWLVKAWPPEPLVYAGIVGILILYRPVRGWVRQPRRLGSRSGAV